MALGARGQTVVDCRQAVWPALRTLWHPRCNDAGASVMGVNHAATRCRQCAAPLTTHQRHAGGLCGDWRCRERDLALGLAQHRSRAAAFLDEQEQETYPIVVVPSWSPELARVTVEEFDALQEHLTALATSLTAELAPVDTDASDDHDSPPAVSPDAAKASMLGAVCGVCKGFCCAYGGTRHAFIDAATLSRYRADNREASGRELVQAYLDRVPNEHFRHACIYQAEGGCSLPRAMRADICNSYACGGLRQASEYADATGRSRSYVVIRADNRIVAGAFVDASRVRRFDPA